MAQLLCGRCGRQTLDSASACPHCGSPLVRMQPVPIRVVPRSLFSKFLSALIVVLVVLAFLKIKSGVQVLTGPKTISSNVISLKVHEAKGLGFNLPSERRVEVKVTAGPEPVDVMMMTKSQWERYNQVRGTRFRVSTSDSTYEHLKVLSRPYVSEMEDDSDLPAGTTCSSLRIQGIQLLWEIRPPPSPSLSIEDVLQWCTQTCL